ncbi:MAG: choice-of-anchor Q domain-containing protein, partial [Bacteroidota bacterium]
DSCTFTADTALGGGALNLGAAATLTNTSFTGNRSSGATGGAIQSTGALTITNVTFKSNTSATNGGAINTTGTLTLKNTRFITNSCAASAYGGAIASDNSAMVATTCTFSGNSGSVATLFKPAGQTTITNSVFSGNLGLGGSNYLFQINGGSSHKITNCTFTGNNSTIGFNLVNTTIYNSIFWDNSSVQGLFNATIDNSIVQDMSPVTGRNINADPMFLTPTPFTTDTFVAPNSNYALRTGSPAINAGFSVALTQAIDTLDVLGNKRQNCATDIGATESSVCDSPPAVIYVDSAAAGTNTGTSWTNAYTYLSDAIYYANNVNEVTEIRVAKGTYYSTGAQSDTNRLTTFWIARGGFKVLGWYPTGGIGARDSSANPVYLDGNINNPADSTDNSTHIMLITDKPSATDSVIIEGFTFRNGLANVNSSGVYNGFSMNHQIGGALHVIDSKTRITSCTFINNSASSGGGALYNNSAGYLRLEKCMFTANRSVGSGGGAAYSLKSTIFQDCNFTKNTTNSSGGALNATAALTVTGCSFTENTAGGTGGAISSTQAITATRCVFAGNTATGNGGAAFTGTAPTFTTCAFTGNQSGASGGAINGAGIVTNGSTFTGNTAQVNGGAIATNGTSPHTNSVFTNNKATTGSGGAIYGATVNSTGCNFTGNSAASSGGAYFGSGATTANTSTFTNNSSGVQGGASSTGSGTFTACTYTGNKAVTLGGAVSTAAAGTFNDCTFRNDTAQTGGGAISVPGTLNAINCNFTGNSSPTNGGAINSGSTATINRCTFTRNSGNTATIYKSGTTILSVFNSLFSGNAGTGSGSYVLRTTASAAHKITNCTFAGNYSESGFQLSGTGSIVNNSIVWSNSTASGLSAANTSYSIVQGLSSGVGNLDQDPLFVKDTAASATGFEVSNSNYNLQAGSPALNSGSNTLLLPTASFVTELMGNTRIISCAVDRGAIEYLTVTAPGLVNPGMGQPATFTASAIPADYATSIVWQDSTAAHSWTAIAGETSTTLVISNLTQAMNGNKYRYQATGTCGSQISPAATLVVGCTNPVIASQPRDTTVTAGQPVSFTVAATPITGVTFTYQWQIDSTGTFTDINGATAANYTIDSTLIGMNGDNFRCHVMNQSCKTTSDTATLTVNPSTLPASLLTDRVAGAAGDLVTINLRVKGFQNYNSIQGNINLGSRVDSVLSITPTTALTTKAGIAGSTAKLAGDTLTYAYESITPFSFADSTIVFTITARLAANNTNDTVCGTPVSSTTVIATNGWGKLPSDFTVPSTQFGNICVAGIAPEIVAGNFRVCAADTSVTIPFTHSGYFASLDAFSIYIDGSKVPSTLNAAKTTITYTGSTPFGTGAKSYTIKDTISGIESQPVVVTPADYDPLVVTINGTAIVSGTNYNYCPGTTLNVALFENSYPVFNGNDTALSAFSIAAGDSLAMYTTSSTGCINPVAFSVFTSGRDTVAPTFSLTASADTLILATNTNGTYHLDSLVSNKADNCSAADSLVTTYFNTNNPATTYTTPLTVEEGTYAITIRVSDPYGNHTDRNFVLYVEEIPDLLITTDGARSTGLGDSTVTILFSTDGKNRTYSFRTFSGQINLGRFAKSEVAVVPAFTSGSFTHSITNGVFSYSATDVILKADTAFFTLSLKTNTALSDTDECYKPVIANTSWITQLGTTAYVESDFDVNCLTGLAVISGTMKNPDGSNWNKSTTVNCAGCINENGYASSASLNSMTSSYSFRALPGTAITLTVNDLSGDNGTVVGTEDAILNRQHVLNTATFNQNQLWAGDVDNSKRINTLDVLQQRNNTVGDVPLFVNNFGNASLYSFVTANGNVTAVPVSKSIQTFDFTVIAIGKVAQYATVPPSIKQANDDLVFGLNDKTVANGTTVLVPVTVNRYKDVAGYQMTLSWNSAVLDYVKIVPAKHSLVSGERLTGDGKVMLSYVDDAAANASEAKGDTLFLVEFRVIGSNGSRSAVSITSDETPATAFDQYLNPKKFALSAANVYVMDASGMSDIGNGYAISNAMPNPFLDETRISFNLPVNQDVTFTIHNNLGQLTSQTIHYSAGLNTWFLPQLDNMPAGMYTVTLNAEGLKYAVKVVKQ